MDHATIFVVLGWFRCWASTHFPLKTLWTSLDLKDGNMVVSQQLKSGFL